MLLAIIFGCVAAQRVEAAELQKETAAAFDRYIDASEKRIHAELQNGPFLFIDELPEPRRADAYAQLRRGQILVQQVMGEEGHPIEVPHGLLHDWMGVLFIPNATLERTLAVVEDYDNHQNIYKPEVRRSKLVSRNGDDFKVLLQLYKKSLVTVAINADFDIHYERLGANRVASRAYSTRLVEVQNAGQADEHELSAEDAHGYLWRLDLYWRFEEKDQGVYVQIESIGLSRAVPAIIGWLVNPLLRSIPRGTLMNLLTATRVAVASARASKSSFRGRWNAIVFRHTDPYNSGLVMAGPIWLSLTDFRRPCSPHRFRAPLTLAFIWN